MEEVGSHWVGGAKVDVVAVIWRERQVLLGEAKWQGEPIKSRIVGELIETKTLKILELLPEEGDNSHVH